jgi:ribosomal protein S9
VTFPTPVTQATAILTGFITEFSGGNDHHLGQLDIQVVVPGGGVSGTSVAVQVTMGLRDWSGTWDDQYDGQVFFTVIGE